MKVYLKALCILVLCAWFVVITASFMLPSSSVAKDAEELRLESEALRRDIDSLQCRLDSVQVEVALLERVYAVAECESGLQHDGCWGDNGRAYGILQFHEPTFIWLCDLSGIKGNWMNREDQLKVGMWAFSHGYDYLWTCSKKVERRVDTHDHNG